MVSIQDAEIHKVSSTRVTTPRKTFYGQTVYNQTVYVVEISYTLWIDKQLSGVLPKATIRRIYLTDEEFVMFKLQGLLQEPRLANEQGYSYVTG